MAEVKLITIKLNIIMIFDILKYRVVFVQYVIKDINTILCRCILSFTINWSYA